MKNPGYYTLRYVVLLAVFLAIVITDAILIARGNTMGIASFTTISGSILAFGALGHLGGNKQDGGPPGGARTL